MSDYYTRAAELHAVWVKAVDRQMGAESYVVYVARSVVDGAPMERLRNAVAGLDRAEAAVADARLVCDEHRATRQVSP